VLASVAVFVLAIAPRGASAGGLPAGWQRGANFTSWWNDTYEKPEAARQLDALRATGTTQIAVVATWYMDAKTSVGIAPDPSRTPSDAGLRAVIAKAKSLGMSVSLKPHVDVRDGTFRGFVAPSDPAAWFGEYRRMLDHYADLGKAAGAEMLVIGTELTTMSTYTAEWRSLIADARSRFPGRLTFAANWTDGARRVGFWDALDYIGIDAYMPLAWTDPDPSVDTLAAAWCSATDPSGGAYRYVDEVAALAAHHQRPVIFTEVGYQSRYGTASAPWFDASGGQSEEPQQRAYEALYRVWSRAPWFKGVYWWDWSASGEVAEPGSYTPQGKAAQTTMSAWNTAAFDGGSGKPCDFRHHRARESGTRTVLSLRVKVVRRGRRHVKELVGRAHEGGTACAGKTVRIRIDRWHRPAHRWRRWKTLRTKVRPSGRYWRVPPKLTRGRYRARSFVSPGRCDRGRSPRLRFRAR
jgi:hypothetical protein